MTSHMQYLQWVGYGGFGLAALRQLVLTIVRLIAVFSGNENVSLRCFEVIRLCHRDAARIPSYLSEPSRQSEPRIISPSSDLSVGESKSSTSASQSKELTITGSPESLSNLSEPLPYI